MLLVVIAIAYQAPGYGEMTVTDPQDSNRYSYDVGPFNHFEEVDATVSLLKDLNARTNFSEKLDQRSLGYIVVTPVFQSSADARDTIASLEDQNIRDFVYVSTGDYANRISMGVFSTYENALVREEYLQQAGFDVETIERLKMVSEWWIHIVGKIDEQQVLANIKASVEGTSHLLIESYVEEVTAPAPPRQIESESELESESGAISDQAGEVNAEIPSPIETPAKDQTAQLPDQDEVDGVSAVAESIPAADIPRQEQAPPSVLWYLLILLLMLIIAGLVWYLYRKFFSKIAASPPPLTALVSSTINNRDEGILVIDSHQDIVLANRSFTAIVNKTSDELVGLPFASIGVAGGRDIKDESRGSLWHDVLTNTVPEINVRVHLKQANNQLGTFLANASPLITETDKAVGAIISFKKVPELDGAQDVSSESTDEAANYNWSAGDFMTRLSPGNEAPIQAIMKYASLLHQGQQVDGVEGRKYLSAISSDGSKMVRLFEDILQLSRLESGQQSLDRIVFSPGSLVKEIVNSLQGSLNAKELSLDVELLDEFAERVVSDPSKIGRLLKDLLLDSIRRTDGGALVLKASVLKASVVESNAGNASDQESINGDSRGSELRFEILDNSHSLLNVDEDKFYNHLESQAVATPEQLSGTELGLLVAKGMVAELNGKLETYSTDEGNVQFIVTIPVDLVVEERAPESHLTVAEEARLNEQLEEARSLATKEATSRREAEELARKEAKARMQLEELARDESKARSQAQSEAQMETKARIAAELDAAQEARQKEQLQKQLTEDEGAREELIAIQEARQDLEQELAAQKDRQEQLAAKSEAEVSAREEAESKLAEEKQAHERLAEQLRAEQEAKHELELQKIAEIEERSRLEARLNAELDAKKALKTKLKKHNKARKALAAKIEAEAGTLSDIEAKLEKEREEKALLESKFEAETAARKELAERIDSEVEGRKAAEGTLESEREAKFTLQQQLEAEAVARKELSEQIQAEEKARESVQQTLEAERKSKQVLEEKLRAESDAIEELSEKTHSESKAREELQAKLQEEHDARVRVEEEHEHDPELQSTIDEAVNKNAELEARVNEELSARAEAETNLQFEIQARKLAEARVEREQQQNKDAQAALEEERKNRIKAEEKVQAEALAAKQALQLAEQAQKALEKAKQQEAELKAAEEDEAREDKPRHRPFALVSSVNEEEAVADSISPPLLTERLDAESVEAEEFSGDASQQPEFVTRLGMKLLTLESQWEQQDLDAFSQTLQWVLKFTGMFSLRDITENTNELAEIINSEAFGMVPAKLRNLRRLYLRIEGATQSSGEDKIPVTPVASGAKAGNPAVSSATGMRAPWGAKINLHQAPVVSSLNISNPTIQLLVKKSVGRLNVFLSNMEASYQNENYSELTKLCYRLRGEADISGLHPFIQPAKELEQYVKTGQVSRIEAGLTHLRELFNRIELQGAADADRRVVNQSAAGSEAFESEVLEVADAPLESEGSTESTESGISVASEESAKSVASVASVASEVSVESDESESESAVSTPATRSMRSESVRDESATQAPIRSHLNLDNPKLKDQVEQFVITLGSQLTELHYALEQQKSHTECRRIALWIVRYSRVLGFDELTQSAKDLVDLAERENDEGIPGKVEELRMLFSRIDTQS
jgi:PAS domain-containing protein